MSSPGNPWLRSGAQLGYTIASKGSVDDLSDFFSGRVEVARFHRGERLLFPIYGNFGGITFKDPVDGAGKLRALINGTSGIQVAVAPYYIYEPKLSGLGRLTEANLYVNVGGKFNRVRQQDDTTKYTVAKQLRTSVGLDLSFDVKGKKPASLILEGVYGYVAKDKLKSITGRSDLDYLGTLEATIIVPLPSTPNFTLIAQGVAFNGGPPMWRLGTLVFAPQSK